ncbi:hypothetical protein HBI56_014840 [Parastagonospora nodorum]|uniref:Uncharacterized protein n=1 Tax=Phaeosphaeria nodorum (strain SN15 / ATCC MYA-4574 / FGSC 10173) TaxID=321614 RepID=A0A7U2I061_PHANO|nr:hypothetical protein HBH56_085140 [Parastagonospora nodorum]QRC96869.1 hypothetical protein JI435_409720 [Parastagonospora nodorum SN15]KAH3929954.1 hypothetical protein HBH54_116700 [Parastagonospora nodorum]KAH3955932.1 hypothetical protein HBH53_007890 [Parastagonospora nodorum]KAH3976863.1 hypothetical protein HBH51_073630 [Parastagonospora nodorum]
MCKQPGQRGCGRRPSAQVPGSDPPGIINCTSAGIAPTAGNGGALTNLAWRPWRSEWNSSEPSGCAAGQPIIAGEWRRGSEGRAVRED